MAEKRYYVVCDCQDCPNVREFGYRDITFKCSAMDEKKLRRFPIIPKWCPLQKDVKK